MLSQTEKVCQLEEQRCLNVLKSFPKKAQLRALLSPCKQHGPVLTLIYIAVGHPQQALLWWKIANYKLLYTKGALCAISSFDLGTICYPDIHVIY